ncbi:MAG: hypothetical protein IPI60_16580 [Saprospiraceae bacterium]|nr:hypothetical protein [Saprospiraceae bacterium]
MEPIERHIKQHFDNKSYSYNEAHWLDAQKLIAENKRRRRGWLIWWTGGVSLILITFLAYWTLSDTTIIVSNMDTDPIEAVEIAKLGTDQNGIVNSSHESPMENTDNISSERVGISLSSGQSFKNPSTHPNKKDQGSYSAYSIKINKREKNSAVSESSDILNQTFTNQQKPIENSANTRVEKNYAAGESESAIVLNQEKEGVEPSELKVQQNLLDESNTVVTEPVSKTEEVIALENATGQLNIVPITPVSKNANFGFGFVAGYLMQKQFTEGQWLNGAYLGGRANWALSPKWSIGTDLSLVIQEMETVHFHHDVISGYGFGRDSIVTDLYAKRAVTLQIPLAVSYAFGKHTISGMIGSRILLDAQARMEKLHYTNADPENTASGVIVSRSTVLTKKNS